MTRWTSAATPASTCTWPTASAASSTRAGWAQAQNALANGFLAERPTAKPSVPAAQLRVVQSEDEAATVAQAEAPGFLGGVALVAPLALTALLTAIIAVAMLFAGAL